MPTLAQPCEPFWITGWLHNPGEPREAAAAFFALEAYGEMWLWPSWLYHHPPEATSFDFEYVELPQGLTRIEVVPLRPWQNTGTDELTGLHMLGAMMDPDLEEILGEVTVVTWGFGP